MRHGRLQVTCVWALVLAATYKAVGKVAMSQEADYRAPLSYQGTKMQGWKAQD